MAGLALTSMCPGRRCGVGTNASRVRERARSEPARQYDRPSMTTRSAAPPKASRYPEPLVALREDPRRWARNQAQALLTSIPVSHVVVLAWMAWQLSRQLNASRPSLKAEADANDRPAS